MPGLTGTDPAILKTEQQDGETDTRSHRPLNVKLTIPRDALVARDYHPVGDNSIAAPHNADTTAAVMSFSVCVILDRIPAEVAGLRGVEPPTTWFVARCSIQLSYRPAETTHAFLLDYDTLPATSTPPAKSNSRARLQIQAPRVAAAESSRPFAASFLQISQRSPPVELFTAQSRPRNNLPLVSTPESPTHPEVMNGGRYFSS